LGEDMPVMIAVAGHEGGRAALVIATNAAARDRGLAAGTILRGAAEAMGGRGGGKPDMAQGGGGEPARIPAALTAVRAASEASGWGAPWAMAASASPAATWTG